MDAQITHPIERGWFGTKQTSAKNYDEFASREEITAQLERTPHAVLALEMPHCTPEAVQEKLSFSDAVARATQVWAEQSDALSKITDSVVVYRIADPSYDRDFLGVFTLVDTDAITSSPEELGSVIRNEDVFEEKVQQRVEIAQSIHTSLSSVLLITAENGEKLRSVLANVVTRSPDLSVTDEDGAEHSVYAVESGSTCEEILSLTSDSDLIVADGNHRSLAAQIGGAQRFLAVIATPDSVEIAPYNRTLVDTGVSAEELREKLSAAGCALRPVSEQEEPARGEVIMMQRDSVWGVSLPRPAQDPEVVSTTMVDLLDHTVVERVIFQKALGYEPGADQIQYVGGSYSREWLRSEVESGRADAALAIAPVEVEDFLAVNLMREKMPRKSTWFTPKARAGLVMAQLPGI